MPLSLANYRNIIPVFLRNRRSALIISLIVASVCLLTQCMNEEVKTEPATETTPQPAVTAGMYAQFAGSSTCASCHKDIYDKHLNTAHYLTSQPAIAKYLRGNFGPDSNAYRFNADMVLKMEKRKDSFYQVAYIGNEEKRAERLDIVVGSATKGQSFLQWTNNELTQLQITWFSSVHQWTNSPGYPGKLLFNRPISSRCLECHTTYAHKLSPENKEPELFDKNEIIFGIDCEKCHGPAAKHVEFYKNNPTDTTGQFIMNPAKLTRQQNLDLCALCHGGRLPKTQPSFTYTVGNKLSDYFKIDTTGKIVQTIDVHGNQLGLLAASKCFQESDMTCSSCHNPHENEKGKLKIYSQRCMNCHATGHEKVCKLTATAGTAITNNCIDCHMPKQQSHSIAVMLQGSSRLSTAIIRTHYIKAYPEETEKVLSFINKQSNK